jgi:hypothetical protein
MKRISKSNYGVLQRISFRHLTEQNLHWALAAAIWALIVGQVASAEEPQPNGGRQAFLGVRVLKVEAAGSVAWAAKLPPDCTGCRLVINEYASGQNSKELFFHLWVPRSRPKIGPIYLKIDPRTVRGVLVGYNDVDLPKRGFSRPERRADGMAPVNFQRVRDGITFDVPLHPHGADLPPDDLADVSEQYTFLETPGVYIRVGHVDERRRRGAYATGPWPAVEARAALNLEFAAREAVNSLQLDSSLQEQGVATIMLMNFDTNYPTLGANEAHDDWPPHWHMHLFWNARPKVRRVSHFYIAPNGLLIEDQCSELKSAKPGEWTKRWYAREEADETRTPGGRLLYSQIITAQGYFTLASPSGTCEFKPVSGGFDSGVNLSCNNGRTALRILAQDDPVTGRLQLFLNDRLAKDYRYDPDTGALLSTKDVSK